MITEPIEEFDEDEIAEEGQPKAIFRANASSMWNTMKSIAKSLNIFGAQLNTTQNEINASETAVQNMKKNIESINTEIDSKKLEIDTKHSEVMNRVIPTEATYNEQTIDEKVQMSQILNLTGAI